MAYSIERKEAVLKKLLPPINQTVAEVAHEEGLSINTLYQWRDKARQSGLPVPGKAPTANDWSAETKLATVIETTPLSESELSQYCREMGLYVDQVKSWKTQCLSGFQLSKAQQREAATQAKADQLSIKALKKELRYKEKALAETAALWVAQKKAGCVLGTRGRGQLSALSERSNLITLIREAFVAGARLKRACEEASISFRTYKRWYKAGIVKADKRPSCNRPTPTNKLTPQEQAMILTTCNLPEYADLPPSQIVPSLLDKAIYYGSESSFYRVLKQAGQLNP